MDIEKRRGDKLSSAKRWLDELRALTNEPDLLRMARGAYSFTLRLGERVGQSLAFEAQRHLISMASEKERTEISDVIRAGLLYELVRDFELPGYTPSHDEYVGLLSALVVEHKRREQAKQKGRALRLILWAIEKANKEMKRRDTEKANE